MDRVGIAVVGVGWIGGIRAGALADNAHVDKLVLCDVDEGRAKDVSQQCGNVPYTLDYRDILKMSDVDAVVISTTPETTHYPLARDSLLAGKHVLLEKPMALKLEEADELIRMAEREGLKFTVGYTQRFNSRYAYVKQSIEQGLLGDVITVLAARGVNRSIGHKISGRIKLSPAVMEATHDIDYVFWCLDGREPKQVYAQTSGKLLKEQHGVPDAMWILITMDDGTTGCFGANWALPPGYPHYSSCFIEFIGTEGSVTLDDTHKDLMTRTLEQTFFPLSTMLGEYVLDVFHGPMKAETDHFIECLVRDREPLVKLSEARKVMETTIAADIAAEKGVIVSLPLKL